MRQNDAKERGKKLAKYVVKRVLLAVVAMFLICFITFLR